MSEKKFHLKPGIVIQGQDFPNGVTSASSDQECILLLSKNKKNEKHFEKLPSDWENIVDSFDPKKDSEEGEEVGLNSLSVPELKEFAELHGIELTAKKKADIIKEIEAGLEDLKNKEQEGAESEEGHEGEEDAEK